MHDCRDRDSNMYQMDHLAVARILSHLEREEGKARRGMSTAGETYMAAGAARAPHAERASRIYTQPYRGRTVLRNFVAPWF